MDIGQFVDLLKRTFMDEGKGIVVKVEPFRKIDGIDWPRRDDFGNRPQVVIFTNDLGEEVTRYAPFRAPAVIGSGYAVREYKIYKAEDKFP